MTSEASGSSHEEAVKPSAKRPVGRPRRIIDPSEVADATALLYHEAGYDGVSIEAVADKLGVSRATLYRTVGSMEGLHTLLFEHSVRNVEAEARALLKQRTDSRDALVDLIRFQVGASIKMRQYIGVYFGWGIPSDAYARWRQWAARYERLWSGAVQRAIDDGHLPAGDTLITTRLILGMVNWVSRWYRPSSGYSGDQIADIAVNLVLAQHHPSHV